MNKFIVTTSIYLPSIAVQQYASMKDWTLIVVGDKKTPHDTYKKMNLQYLSPEYQETAYPELSEAIGWNCIMRRNIGFLEAYKQGADIVATVDDDNIPYNTWGKNVLIGQEVTMDCYENSMGVFDPLKATNYKELWHRGYPLEYVNRSETYYNQLITKKVLIQADLWDGDPDVDAVCRMLYNPKDLKLNTGGFYTSLEYAPFNSQNTFLAREVLPYYMVLPWVGRVDDIWGGYICQFLTGARPVFGPPTVYQERNEQSIYKNFNDEVFGYTNTISLLKHMEKWAELLPEKALNAFNLYRKEYDV